MLKKITFPLVFLLFIWFIVSSEHARTIIAGIALFLIGMNYMENGFKLFSGGSLETILEKFTRTTPRAIGTGFLATAVVQSSSLVTVIIISFLSAGLIGLTQAVGVIFGSNVGTTATAWLVSSIGLKISIAQYALPMLIFGVVMQFSKRSSYKGFGSVLIGLGFIFLGIDYMKEGFETLRENINLAEYAIPGYLGVFVFILFGAIATVIIQSSSATMAIIITALASGQIDYVNALSLAIGTNVGTTVTAAIAAVASNKNGKRLAVAHLIFNVITALIAVVFIYQLAGLVDKLAPVLSISETNVAMKLALFHTLFNVIGVLAVSPFIKYLVRFLQTLFKPKAKDRSKAKYLTDEVMELPSTALAAIRKETIHLYDISLKAVVHAMNLRRREIFSDKDIDKVLVQSVELINIDIDKIYQKKIKNLYSEIIHFASMSQSNMDSDDNSNLYELRLTARSIVEMVKDVRELQKNLNHFSKSKNTFMINEYDKLRSQLIAVLRSIQEVRNEEENEAEQEDILTRIEVQKEKIIENEMQLNRNIGALIRENKISATMASSLINDIGFTFSICRKLLNSATTLWLQEKQIKQLSDDYEY